MDNRNPEPSSLNPQSLLPTAFPQMADSAGGGYQPQTSFDGVGFGTDINAYLGGGTNMFNPPLPVRRGPGTNFPSTSSHQELPAQLPGIPGDYRAAEASKGAGVQVESGWPAASTKRDCPGDQDAERKMRQKMKKREAARRRYHSQQKRLSDLEKTVEDSTSRNAELQKKLDELLCEQKRLAEREEELVARQKTARSELESMKAQVKASGE